MARGDFFPELALGEAGNAGPPPSRWYAPPHSRRSPGHALRGATQGGNMKSVTRSLSTVLTVAAAIVLPTAAGRGVVTSESAAAQAPAPKSDRAHFVGTYELVM